MNRSFFIAGLLAIGATAWIASGQYGQSSSAPVGQKPPADLRAEAEFPLVRVRLQSAAPHSVEELLRGRTEAIRMVDVRVESDGRIEELLVDRGSRVGPADVLAKQSPEERPAALAEAKALLAQKQIEYAAAEKLSKKGFRAETQLAASRAELEAADAAVRQAQIALENLTITAPFEGLVDDRMVEIGDYLKKGDHLVRIVDLDPILIIAQANERDVGRLVLGQQGVARLASGVELNGRVRFISSIADAATRTFRVELEVPNPSGAVADGLTAELRLNTPAVMAHRVSPAILTLSEEGVLGVKTLDRQDRVTFQPVKIIDSDKQGVWLAGLPDEVILITVGQEFVKTGQTVTPIDEGTLQPFIREAGS